MALRTRRARSRRGPDSGMVGFRLFGLPRTPTVLQCWTSLDELYDYASQPQALHRPAWASFNARARPGEARTGSHGGRSNRRALLRR
ncbi:monooxygenase family protein [Microbacterium sp. G2-8]|uniref:monooxygenase family protein n=1 Tax=Microbacterium sp. G2-8 TaxID=2842454 RepID=UPI0035A91C5A